MDCLGDGAGRKEPHGDLPVHRLHHLAGLEPPGGLHPIQETGTPGQFTISTGTSK